MLLSITRVACRRWVAVVRRRVGMACCGRLRGSLDVHRRLDAIDLGALFMLAATTVDWLIIVALPGVGITGRIVLIAPSSVVVMADMHALISLFAPLGTRGMSAGHSLHLRRS